MGPINNATYLIQHVASVLSKQTDQLLEEQLDIRLSQYRILMVLEWNPRIEQKVIGSALGQTEASISRQVKLLIKKGLLTTRADSQNKRRHIAIPTPIGMQITEAATALIKQHFANDFDKIKPSQLSAFNDSLKLVHKSICKQGKLGACNHLLGL